MRPIILGAILFATVVAGCDQSRTAEPTPPPDTHPVAETAPYLCDLVPEQALRRVTGLAIPLDARWVNGPQPDNGLCLAYAKGREAPLGIDWSLADGEKTVRFQERKWAQETTHPLPAELGKGLAVVIPTAGGVARPNYVIAVFTCGKKKPWMSIDFAPVVRGRDAVQDMVAFMRIAERRFGVLHGCTPRGG